MGIKTSSSSLLIDIFLILFFHYFIFLFCIRFSLYELLTQTDLRKSHAGYRYSCRNSNVWKWEQERRLGKTGAFYFFVLNFFFFSIFFYSILSFWMIELKLIYSEKAAKFCEIFPLHLTICSTYSQK